MGKTESKLAIFCSQSRLPVLGFVHTVLSFRLKGSREEPYTTQANAKTESHTLKPESVTPLTWEIFTQLIEYNEH